MSAIVYASITGAMQHLESLVRWGSHDYVTGAVPLDRALALEARLVDRYAVLRHGARHHASRNGRAVFRLVMVASPTAPELHWWLLRSEGTHPLLSLESWRDAREKRQRLTWPWWYELVREPLAPALAAKYSEQAEARGRKRKASDTPWTWRMRADVIEEQRALIRHAAQLHHDTRLRQLIHALSRAPGFRGVRADVYQLYGYIRRQCEMRRMPVPPIPETIRWVPGLRPVAAPVTLMEFVRAAARRR